MSNRERCKAGWQGFAVILIACIFAVTVSSASACDIGVLHAPVKPTVRIASTEGAVSWFVEFRARGGSPVGHSSVAMGIRTATGRERIVRYAGYYAQGGSFGGVASILGYPAIVGYKAADTQRADIRLRRTVDRSVFRTVERIIHRVAADPGMFTMLANNCNAFVARIAKRLGLKTPRLTAQNSLHFMREMVALNSRRRR